MHGDACGEHDRRCSTAFPGSGRDLGHPERWVRGRMLGDPREAALFEKLGISGARHFQTHTLIIVHVKRSGGTESRLGQATCSCLKHCVASLQKAAVAQRQETWFNGKVS